MDSGFGERIAPTAAIKSILDTYPYSIGLFRELLQNSDDAKATHQIFVLDSRQHPKSTLYHERLNDTQGPALLAANNTQFSDADWEAIQTIYQSSKVVDTSKIGKYGIGFRSSYHITDNPEILSGSSLAILDPHCAFSKGGVKLDFAECAKEYPDQLAGFDYFLSEADLSHSFSGTVIRLPLRTPRANSAIRDKIVQPAEIRQLFIDFIKEEIGMALLFLTHVSSIEVCEIDDQGRRCLARAKIVKGIEKPQTLWPDSEAKLETYDCIVTVDMEGKESTAVTWRILKTSFSEAESAEIISERLQCDASSLLTQAKLFPEIAIAMPLSLLSSCPNSFRGRLFTYLPLPLPTGFPCHVHGLFALTSSRQNLRNGNEMGVVSHSKDSVLIEWNRILFEIFLPRTWAMLLQILITKDGVGGSDIFRAWPPAQSIVTGGDTFYWRSLPENLLRVLGQRQLRVWPVYFAAQHTDMDNRHDVPVYEPLQSVLVASNEDDEILTALTLAGVAIAHTPRYILDILSRSDIQHTALTPATARLAIIDDPSRLSALHEDNIRLIMIYLLSTSDLINVSGIPFFPTIHQQFIALRPLDTTDTHPTHVLMTRSDACIFSMCDQSAVALFSLPPSVSDLLIIDGPSILNVTLLTCGRVINYLRYRLNFESLFPTSVKSVDDILWLARFWEWVVEWPHRRDLISLIGDMPLVPTTCNRLTSLRHRVFYQTAELSPLVFAALEILHLNVIHPKIPPPVVRMFQDDGFLTSPYLIHRILDLAVLDDVGKLNSNIAEALRNHIATYLSDSCRLTSAQQRALRALPIFPILVPSTTRATSVAKAELGLIGEGRAIKAVNMTLLPIIEDTVYIDESRITFSLLSHLHNGAESPILSDPEVLAMAVDHLHGQPKHLQRAFVEYIVAHRDDMSSRLISRLETTSFVAVANGSSFKAPVSVVDPISDVAGLFDDGVWLPHRGHGEDEEAILSGLRSLGMLIKDLTDDIVLDRIESIPAGKCCDADRRSRLLIRLMNKSGFDGSGLTSNPDFRWLPTKNGPRRPQECHHHSAHDAALFDEVLISLDVEEVTSSLRSVLLWNRPLPLDIVKEQLKVVLQRGCHYRKFEAIIRELGGRIQDLDDGDIDELRTLTSERPWIPTSSDCVITTSRAVFSPTSVPGFYRIPHSYGEGARALLRRIGCTNRPSNNALIQELTSLQQQKPTSETVKHAILLLENLSEGTGCADLPDKEHDDIFVPDSGGQFRPISRVYFNDINDRAGLVQLPDGHFVAHHKVDDDLAQKLQMKRLGLSELKYLDFDDDEDMGEPLTNRIRTILRQYTMKQTLNEFVANAVDAGANSLAFIIDERPAGQSRVLSPAMAKLQSGPSLVIHNNAIFTEDDFRGLRRVGSGGKEGRTDTIGQFGLGALSMFHFTEVPMILSGGEVMFLDPSKTYLPCFKRASIKLPLSNMKRFYSDHVDSLDGLFGFRSTMDYYDGTIFRLPLRDASQARTSEISETPLSMRDLRHLIEGDFWELATHPLLFTSLDFLGATSRGKSAEAFRWSVSAVRGVPKEEDGFSSRVLDVCACGPRGEKSKHSWQIVSAEFPQETLPKKFQPLVTKHRLRFPISIGLAARLTSPVKRCNLFSRLPLPILTSLPVHLHGTFILAEDRRSVRYDGDGRSNLESQYNRWVLTDLIPPLYLFLLQVLLLSAADNGKWWPGTSESVDCITECLVDSFYQQLAAVERCVCPGVTGNSLRPREAVLLRGGEPSSVEEVLRSLQPPDIVNLPTFVRKRIFDAKGIKPVWPDFVVNVFQRDMSGVKAALTQTRASSQTLNLLQIESIISFLLGTEGHSYERLVDLPLLPLSDQTLAVFKRSGNSITYYDWRPSPQSKLRFPDNRLVHPSFHPGITWEDASLNVSELRGSGVRELVGQCILEEPERGGMVSSERQWIHSFWSGYETLKADTGLVWKDISYFPLVPTTHKSHYVSLAHCRTAVVIFVDSSSTSLDSALEHLGAVVVPRQRCQPSLLSIFDSEGFWDLRSTFIMVVKFFENIGVSMISSRFSRLSSEERSRFATWARDQISLTREGDLKQHIPTIKRLPIWPAYLGGTRDAGLLPALDVRMLPSGVSCIAIGRFLPHSRAYVEHTYSLGHLGVKPLTFREFRDILDLPRQLTPESEAAYKELLRILISHFPEDGRDVLVPDRNRVMRMTGNTYASSERLFRTAFETRPQNFIQQSFQDLEGSLTQFGLRHLLNFATFKECARAISEDTHGGDRVRRASLVFDYYSETLPIVIGSDSEKWRQLACLEFIPRGDARNRSTGFDPTNFVQTFRDVVSPNQILRPDSEAIAWTQRALFMVPPDERLLLANLTLGLPTAQEVVDHLRILTLRLAPEHTSNTRILSDITETYRWLDDHVDEATKHIIQHFGEPLWLNVDDPRVDSWVFHSSGQIFIGIYDSGKHYAVREFLMTFRKLLIAADVQRVENPPIPESPATNSELQLSSMLSRFERLRSERKLTDVVFISDDGTEFWAHRTLLTALDTEYFMNEFCGGFSEANTYPATIKMEGYSTACLKFVLDFIYKGPVEVDADNQEELLNTLLNILDLSHYWGLADIHTFTQNKLIPLISLDSYEGLHEHANLYNATALMKACQFFEERNASVLEKLGNR